MCQNLFLTAVGRERRGRACRKILNLSPVFTFLQLGKNILQGLLRVWHIMPWRGEAEREREREEGGFNEA